MLAKLADELPRAGDYLFEPKWDGFRALVFRGEREVFIQSRDSRPLDRYFPELHEALIARLPKGCVLDGEIVIATPRGLDFDALQLRLHPAASRVEKLARETPSSFVAFDALAIGGRTLMAQPQRERRAALEKLLSRAASPVYLTPMTHDRDQAQHWLEHFEGAGLDGVIAKSPELTYQPGKRAMIKVKHARTAECVVAGIPLAQKRKRRGRLAAPWPLRRCGKAAARRRHELLHHGDAPATGEGARAAAQRRDARASMARLGGRCGRIEPHARRREPLERGQGPLVGAAAS